MTDAKNAKGLSRYIPAAVARAVRQKSGFGCIICGLALYQYEHFDPPFEGASEQNPAGITLLCGACHDAKTRGHLSVATLRKAVDNPKSFKQGYARAAFDIGENRPSFLLGGTRFEGMETLIEVNTEPLFSLRPAEAPDAPYRLSGLFCDPNSQELFRIVDNEWQGDIAAWDIEVVGAQITVRAGARRIALEMHVEPPHLVSITQIDMAYKGASIRGKVGGPLTITSPEGSVFKWQNVGSFQTPPEGVGIHVGSDGIDIARARRAGDS